jgi:hypothetical protein
MHHVVSVSAIKNIALAALVSNTTQRFHLGATCPQATCLTFVHDVRFDVHVQFRVAEEEATHQWF